MTLIIQLPNTTPYPFIKGMYCKTLGTGLPQFTAAAVNDICICDFVTCEYNEKVFADPTTTDYWKNDKNDFLYKRLIAADTVTIKLFKNGTELTTIVDNTLGTFVDGFTVGNGYSNTSAEQQLYVYFLIDWKLVEAAHGVGEYQIKTDLIVLGNATTDESRKFNLCIYSDRAANGTVRIETTQNGNIIGGNFDFTNLNLSQSLRIPGSFGNPTPVYEQDRYVTATRKRVQIKDTMRREWTLKTMRLPYEVTQKLIYNKLLANEILITDYTIDAESIWRRIGVFPSEIEKPESFGNPNKIFIVKFVDNKDIFIKRNF